MAEIVQNLPTYMLVGVAVILGVSQFHRLLGSILGVLFWIAVAIVGRYGYAVGGAVGIHTLRFSETVFYGICVGFVILNASLGYADFLRRRKRHVSEPDD